MTMRKLLTIGLLGAVLGTSVLAGRRPPSAAAQPVPFALSAEEVVIALTPYELTAQDAPSGYVLDPTTTTVDTPATFSIGATDQRANFNESIAAGLVVRVDQNLNPVRSDGKLPSFTFSTVLFTDSASTKAYASGQSLPAVNDATTQYDPATLPATIGDASFAYHATFQDPGQPKQGGYSLRWQHGRLAFRIFTSAPAGQERLDDAVALATTFDKREAALPALVFGAATVQPPATEAQRFEALLTLKTLIITSDNAPAGYNATSENGFPNAAYVALDTDPVTALHRVDEQWKRVMTYSQSFANADNSIGLFLVVALDANAAAAKVDTNDFQPPTVYSATAIAAPAQLGDLTLAHTLTGTNPADGSPVEALDLSWTHGAVVLDVSMSGAAGSTSMDTLLAFARQADAVYQASSFASGR